MSCDLAKSYGSGSGSGSGSGYGDGSGYGYGDGSGYGDGDLNLFLNSYQKGGCVMAFWRSNEDGSPSNGGTGGPRKLGQVETITGPLTLCTKNALHGTLEPKNWKGDRWWIVALYEPVQSEGDKIGSLKREIVADLGKCPFNEHNL